MDHHYAVTIAGLPKMFVKASSPVEVKTKLRKMLKRPTEDIIDVERVTDADVRKHFRDMLKPDMQNEETYSPQKHEWGTDAAALWAKEMTPGEEKKKEKTVTVKEGKTFFDIRESMKSADRVPQTYRDPDTGKMITRMVRHSKNIVDKDKGKDKDVEEAVRIRDRARQQFDPSHGKKDGSMQSTMDRHNIAKAAVDRRKVTRGGGVKGFNSRMVGKKPQDASQDIGSVRARKEAKTYDSGWKKIKKDDKKVSPMDRVKKLAQKGMKQAEKK